MAFVEPEKLVQIQDGDKVSKVILIGELNEEQLPESVAAFVRSVQEFKAAAVNAGSVWWVNQGKTYRQERDGKFIWAPQTISSGATLGHHENVSRVQATDIVVHYANGSVVALGQVQAAAEESSKPTALENEQWGKDGWSAASAG